MGHFWAWDYLKTKPQVLETQYPYLAKDGSCSSTKSSGGQVTVSTYSRVTPGSVAQHKAAAEQGVLGIALAAGSSAFQLYRSGVLTGTSCGTQINHAVATVGWGTENGQDYWIVKTPGALAGVTKVTSRSLLWKVKVSALLSTTLTLSRQTETDKSSII